MHNDRDELRRAFATKAPVGLPHQPLQPDQPLHPLTARAADEIARSTGRSLADVERFALEEGWLPTRYVRNLGTLGREGQLRLLESTVLVAGLGGLGGYVLDQLLRAGAGTIVAADPDRFDEQNLNRQVLCTTDAVGRLKVEVAAERAGQVNPAVLFVGHAAAVESLPDDAFRGVAVAFDCLDNLGSRLALEDRCAAAAVPLIHGAVGGWCVEVGVAWPGSNLLHQLYGSPKRSVEQTLGTPPFAPGAAASLMVAEGVKILLGLAPAGQTRLMMWDMLAGEGESNVISGGGTS